VCQILRGCGLKILVLFLFLLLPVFLALKPSTALCVKYNEAADKLFSEFGKGAASWGIDTENTVLYGSVVEWILQVCVGVVCAHLCD